MWNKYTRLVQGLERIVKGVLENIQEYWKILEKVVLYIFISYTEGTFLIKHIRFKVAEANEGHFLKI